MKKLLMLAALGLVIQTAPVLAGHHEDGEGKKGGFSQVDTDGNGSISKAEYLAHAEKKFAEKDKDGNGEISQDEAKEHRAVKKEKMKEMREKMKEKRAERKAEKEAEQEATSAE